MPAIHKKLVDKFPEGFKSDGTVEHYLLFDEGYNKAAASEIVAEFKETATYAGVFEPAIVLDKFKGEGGMPDPLPIGVPAGKPPPTIGAGQVKIMEGERIVFTEESNPQVYLKLIASGEVDTTLLEALDDYVKRQRKRLSTQTGAKSAAANDPKGYRSD